MTWDLWDDGTRVAVGFGRNIYKVRPDCVLMILGPDFKECPRPEKPCPREGLAGAFTVPPVPQGVVGQLPGGGAPGVGPPDCPPPTCDWNWDAGVGPP